MATYKLNSYGVVEYPPNDAEDNPFINSTEVAEHFQVKEFTCSQPGDTTWIHPQLAYALEKLRTEFFRRAITIYSGHRTVAYNDNLPGWKRHGVEQRAHLRHGGGHPSFPA